MKQSDLKAIASHMFPHLAELLKAEIAAHVSAGLATTAGAVIDAGEALAERAFAANAPGIGGPVPELPAPPPVAGSVPDADGNHAPGPMTLEHLASIVGALSAKLDALVQATGHGNSAAMGSHL